MANDDSRNWRDDAKCAQIGGDLWFPERGLQARDAKAICAQCTVREQCLEFALNDATLQHGLWAGKTPRELREMRKARGLEGAALPDDMEPEDEGVYGG